MTPPAGSSPTPRSTRRARSPWVGVDPNVDPLKWARVLRKAHKLALSKGATPPVLRPIVANSWRRAAELGVDPDGYAPTVLDDAETARALSAHRVSHLLPMIAKMLSEATDDAEYFAVLSDANGLLLWIDGHPRALDAATQPGFLPGHLCSEAAVGTNAVGTALEINHPVQIFSAEHFNRRLHTLTCSAAPIRDPESGHTIGVLDLSGSFRTGHPHSLPLVSAVARVIEETLSREQQQLEERLKALYIDLVAQRGRGSSAVVTRSGRVLAASPRGWLGPRLRVRKDGRLALPDGVEASDELLDGGAFLIRAARRPLPAQTRPAIEVRPLGGRRACVSIGDWHTELSPRHSQILMLLVLHPEGLGSDELRSRVYGDDTKAVTLRAEISRLRRLLGPILASNPYRLEARVRADRGAIERALG
jgi:GAF domain